MMDFSSSNPINERRAKKVSELDRMRLFTAAVRFAKDAVGFTYEQLAGAITASGGDYDEKRVREDLGRPTLGAKVMSRHAHAVLDLCHGSAAYGPFLNFMEQIGVLESFKAHEWLARTTAEYLKDCRKLGVEPWEIVAFGMAPASLFAPDDSIVLTAPQPWRPITISIALAQDDPQGAGAVNGA
jgi:hypothetical protein